MQKANSAKYIFVLLLVAHLSSTALAQSISAIKINPLSPIANRLVLGYEKSIAPNRSVAGTLGYIGGTSTVLNDTIRNKCAGLFIIPEFRYYPKKQAIEGFYLSASVRYFSLRENQYDLVYDKNKLEPNYSRNRYTQAFGFGGGLGYQGVEKRFVYDFGFSLYVNNRNVSYKYTNPAANDLDFERNRGTISIKTHDNLGVRIVLSIGYIINGTNNKKTIGFINHNERTGIAQRYQYLK